MELQRCKRQQPVLRWTPRQRSTITLKYRCSRCRCGAPGMLPLRAQAAPATAAQPGLAAEAAPLDGKLKIIGAQQ